MGFFVGGEAVGGGYGARFGEPVDDGVEPGGYQVFGCLLEVEYG